MPIYEYACPHCRTTFEEWLKTDDAAAEHPCPDCGRAARRLISNTSFVLKGGGWYVTEYGNHKEAENALASARDEAKGSSDGSAGASADGSADGSADAPGDMSGKTSVGAPGDARGKAADKTDAKASGKALGKAAGRESQSSGTSPGGTSPGGTSPGGTHVGSPPPSSANREAKADRTDGSKPSRPVAAA